MKHQFTFVLFYNQTPLYFCPILYSNNTFNESSAWRVSTQCFILPVTGYHIKSHGTITPHFISTIMPLFIATIKIMLHF